MLAQPDQSVEHRLDIPTPNCALVDGEFDPGTGTRALYYYVGCKDLGIPEPVGVWTSQFGNGHLDEKPYITLHRPEMMHELTPEQAEELADQLRIAAQVARQWSTWTPASAQLEELDQR